MGFFSQMQRLRVRIVRGERSGPPFSIEKGVSFRLDITGVTLVALAVWLGAALVLNLTYYLALLMTLALVVALPSTLRLMLYFTPIERDSTEPPST
jgi:hypothetical protein